MLSLTIPGREALQLHHLVLDFNGTLAEDGKLLQGVEERLRLLSGELTIHVITADTNGSVAGQCGHLPLSIHIIGRENQAGEKQRFVEQLQPHGTVCIGNGSNDRGMFAQADLAIAIIGAEGCATSALLQSDIAVNKIVDALDLLIHTNRIIATLRN